MRVISIRQPWAWLIIHGGKDVENRTWCSAFRGLVLIHASKGMTREEYEAAMDFQNSFTPTPVILPKFAELQRGGIVGQCRIIDCVTEHPSKWFVGPYGFVIRDAYSLPFHPCKGALGFFKAPAGYAVEE